MIRDFSREDLEPVESNHTELTLGLGTVLGLGVGLLLLCVVCFALGYLAGHRSSTRETAAVLVPDSPAGIPPGRTGAKPGATRQAPAQPSPVTTVNDADRPPSSTAEAASGSLADSSAAQSAGAQVRPALQGSTDSQAPAPLHVQPATSQVQGWMVQIAAVSRTDDADVLIGALKKRGYAVTARRELGDNLIHVQTGPFTSRNDANSMRQKLLNDGYNAIVQ
ncbi:SPOR domain-containing protein [Occallatibacter savannae]|uniref:SPOR domain-containing protein n=1 Tax=Occallatibacter savannae TaxID=1002691 RepID=UPI000D68BF6C|nr:SPOR domain-containing protein [Occallatibacter savannae]